MYAIIYARDTPDPDFPAFITTPKVYRKDLVSFEDFIFVSYEKACDALNLFMDEIPGYRKREWYKIIKIKIVQ